MLLQHGGLPTGYASSPGCTNPQNLAVHLLCEAQGTSWTKQVGAMWGSSICGGVRKAEEGDAPSARKVSSICGGVRKAEEGDAPAALISFALFYSLSQASAGSEFV